MTAAALLALAAWSWAAPAQVTWQKDRMWNLWDDGLINEARAQAREILRTTPGDLEARKLLEQADPVLRQTETAALRERAVRAFQARDAEAALAAYKRLVELSPNDHLAVRDYMWAGVRTGRRADAETAARRLLELKPGDVEAYEALYRAAYDAGDLAASLDGARALVERWPKKPENWTRLGTVQLRREETAAARDSFAKSLALRDDPQVRLSYARCLVTEREFEKAIAVLHKLESAKQGGPAVLPLMARSLYWLERYEEALRYWERAVEAFPVAADYAYFRGLTLAALGRRPEARRILLELTNRPQGHRAAFNYLVDDAVSHGELAEAASLLEKRLRKPAKADGGYVGRLALLYGKLGREAEIEPLIDRYLEVEPESQDSWLQKAVLALRAGRFSDAERATVRAARINPDHRDLRQLFADLETLRGRTIKAAAVSESALARHPTYPPDVLAHARRVYDAGRKEEAVAFVEDYIRRNRGPGLLILLYHGLARDPQDPMLSWPYHHARAEYEGHLAALKAAGYESVDAAAIRDWLDGKRALPAKPVHITFDDGRMDSFKEGDPALEKHGFKAAMMAALVNTEGRPHPAPGYASWDQIKAYQDTGRWEIQAHGDLAHIHVPNGPETVGLFLVNRKWLPEEGRLESKEAWAARVAADHKSNADKIEARLGRRPFAYAFPEGAYGQKEDSTNVPGTSDEVIRMTGEQYRLAYTQDKLGMNTRGRDPLRMSRLEPQQGWSGKRLVDHARDKHPVVEAERLLALWASAEGRRDEAYRRADEMKADGATDQNVLSLQAEIELNAGDYPRARALADQALRLGPNPDLEKLFLKADKEDDFQWDPAYWWQDDNFNRKNWLFNQTLTLPRRGPARFRIAQRHSEARDQGIDVVRGDGAGAGVDLNLAAGQLLRLDGGYEFFSGLPADDYAYGSARLRSRWTDRVATLFEGGREPLRNGRSLVQNIRNRYALLEAHVFPAQDWAVLVHQKLDYYTDDNGRNTSRLEVRRGLGVLGLVEASALYRFTFDDSRVLKNQSYFTPQTLVMNGAGVVLTLPLASRAKATARYLPGYATEKGYPGRFVQEAEVAGEIRWGKSGSLRPAYIRYQSPSYWSNTILLELTQRFP